MCSEPILSESAQPTFGTPELLSAPGQPPMITGKPLEKVTIESNPHPPTTAFAILFILLPNFLPRPNGRSITEAITRRCGTSNPSRLRALRRLYALESPQVGEAASNQLISELVLSINLATV